jgi:hypothetical protein
MPVAATCCHIEPVEPQNDQRPVAAFISSSSSKLVDLANLEPSEAFSFVLRPPIDQPLAKPVQPGGIPAKIGDFTVLGDDAE